MVEETGGPRENHRPVASHWQTLSPNVVHLAMIETRTHNITDCIGSCNSNYHTITATTTPMWDVVVLFVEIGGIVDHHCLNIFKHTRKKKKKKEKKTDISYHYVIRIKAKNDTIVAIYFYNYNKSIL